MNVFKEKRQGRLHTLFSAIEVSENTSATSLAICDFETCKARFRVQVIAIDVIGES